MKPSINSFFRRVASLALCLSLLVATGFAIVFDSTFASGGRFTTTFASTGDPSTAGSRVFIQPSGRIIVIGRHVQQGADGRVNGIAIAALTSGGILDNGFGPSGKVLVWNAGANILLNEAVMLPGGSLILAYQHLQPPNTNVPVLVKYSVDGQVDASFTADPRVNPFPTTQIVRFALGNNGKMYLLLLHNSNYFLMRLNSDGSRDTSFGANGVRDIVVSRIPNSQRGFVGLHELEDGKIILTGLYSEPQGFSGVGFAMRFDSDTNIDRSFGRQGVMTVSLPYGSVGITRSAVQQDGKLLLAGYYTFLGSNALIARLTTRGRLDASFGSAGIMMTSFDNINSIYGITLATDGRIIVAGTTGAKAVPSNQRFFVSRFSTSGVRESFIDGNFVAGREAAGADVALQTDGKMVVAGSSRLATGFFSELGVARLSP